MLKQTRTGPVADRRWGAALDRLSAAALILAGVALVVMALVQAWQVFARYVLNDSPGWTEPVALLAMSFTVMFGAAVAVRRESHFAFRGVVDASPHAVRRAMKVFTRLIAAASGLGLTVMGAILMVDDWPVAMAGAPLPSGLRFAALFAGGALIFVFALERLLTGDFPSAEEE